MQRFKDINFWGAFIILWAFYLLAAAGFHYQQVIVGAAVALFVCFLNYDLLFTSGERSVYGLKGTLRLMRYFLVLIYEIVKANIQVAQIVLHPAMPISPGIVKFKSPVHKDLNKVILANSITLTPGTLTVAVEGPYYYVHALTKGHAEDVSNWSLGKELAAIEGASKR